jgi:hypothetical protein
VPDAAPVLLNHEKAGAAVHAGGPHDGKGRQVPARLPENIGRLLPKGSPAWTLGFRRLQGLREALGVHGGAQEPLRQGLRSFQRELAGWILHTPILGQIRPFRARRLALARRTPVTVAVRRVSGGPPVDLHGGAVGPTGDSVFLASKVLH